MAEAPRPNSSTDMRINPIGAPPPFTVKPVISTAAVVRDANKQNMIPVFSDKAVFIFFSHKIAEESLSIYQRRR